MQNGARFRKDSQGRLSRRHHRRCRACDGGAGASMTRAQAGHGRRASRAVPIARASASASASSIRTASSPARRSRSRTRARAISSAPEIPRDLQRQWIQGTGPAARPGASVEIGLRNVAYALLERRRRLDVRRRGRARPGVDDVARQPAQPEAGDSSRSDVHGRSPKQVAAEMNKWATGLLRPADRRRLAASSSISRPRSSAPAACISTIGTCATPTAPASPHRSSTRRSTSSTTTGGCVDSGASIVLYLPKIQTAEEAALWNDILTALEQQLGLADRHDQGLRARRAGRGVLPVDGDPRRARPALRRLQHRALGLHQQRVGCGGVGSGLRQSRTSTPSR